jgi:beta-glucosidase/6-phospho-beta-glucosidase/beta-galactosidase
MRGCAGIEDTAIGVPIRHSGRTLDEYGLTEHDRRYREDLDLAASLGIDGLRYGVPWYRVNPAPDEMRWDLVDPIVEHASRRGIELIIDLVHYGVPAWLDRGFVDPGYPDAIETYAGAFAHRYRDLITHYTPLNEPLITGAFCGETGGWPPYLTGYGGWTAVITSVARGIQRASRAIRQAIPGATIVHVEAAKIVTTSAPELEAEVALERERAWLPTDLVFGRVDESHPMWGWLLEHGASPGTLRDCSDQTTAADVVGINFYPQYSVRELMVQDGRTVQVAGGGTADHLTGLLAAFARRYERPVAVTETSYDGEDRSRVRWLRESVKATLRAQSPGVDVWGYTWWPLFDFVDWGIAAGGYPLEDIVVRQVDSDGSDRLDVNSPPHGAPSDSADVSAWLRRMGLWRLEPDASGLARVETPAANAMRAIISEYHDGEAASQQATGPRT